MRTIQDTESIKDEAGHATEYLRGLFVEAGAVAETKHTGEYQRGIADVEGVSLRHLFVFIRLVTLSLVRDYLIPRFLRAQEELVLKSPVTKGIELDSRIR
jgi:hypothetical protein